MQRSNRMILTEADALPSSSHGWIQLLETPSGKPHRCNIPDIRNRSRACRLRFETQKEPLVVCANGVGCGEDNSNSGVAGNRVWGIAPVTNRCNPRSPHTLQLAPLHLVRLEIQQFSKSIRTSSTSLIVFMSFSFGYNSIFLLVHY